MTAKNAHQLPLLEYGEVIEGTSLRRRFENGREIMPIYVGPDAQFSAAFDKAMDQALQHGYKSVIVQDQAFVYLWGQWVGWPSEFQ